MTASQPAHNPNISNTRSVLRPLTDKEIFQRARAISSHAPSPRALTCSGQIFIGMFFDGTGNNEEEDFKKFENKPSEQQHSNVVRLYHAYPDKVTRGTDKYYSYYIPGVGTKFKEISDEGGKMGTAAAWNGEPRVIWGITRIFNAISNYVADVDLIPDGKAAELANAIGGFGTAASERRIIFKNIWPEQLRLRVLSVAKNKPKPVQINLSVYGFSRGAAQARAFVNWLFELCKEEGGGYTFAGIPLRVEFMGLFDTVASVGMAGAFTDGPLGVEGRQSWADKNMQINKGVESCLHLVAAHEVRSTFPLDSVRVDGRYPPNAKEYVFPGAHSDVGGGYHPKAQGKTDALARIAGYEMYCAALAAGVPFGGRMLPLRQRVLDALVPSQAALNTLQAYMDAAKIQPGPVEDMVRQHMAHYFRYRYQGRNDPRNQQGSSYISREFYKKATTQERQHLRDSQQNFIAILAAVGETLDSIMESESSFDSFVHHPFQGSGSSNVHLAAFKHLTAAAARPLVMNDALDNGSRDRAAHKVHEKLKPWREWLASKQSPDLVDEDAPERTVLSVVETLSDQPLPAEVVSFFDQWVHDSVAGLALDGAPEFLLNGIGMAKFRRVYFGDKGDAMSHRAAAEMNAQRRNAARRLRQQRKQWDMEAEAHRRTRW